MKPSVKGRRSIRASRSSNSQRADRLPPPRPPLPPSSHALVFVCCCAPTPVRCFRWSQRCVSRAHSLKMPPRPRYSNQEYLEMVSCYRECNNVTAHAVNLYEQRFGVRVSHHTIVYGQTGHDIRTVRELKRRIKRAFQQVKSETDTLNKVQRHVRKRAYICVQREGGLVQQFCR